MSYQHFFKRCVFTLTVETSHAPTSLFLSIFRFHLLYCLRDGRRITATSETESAFAVSNFDK